MSWWLAVCFNLNSQSLTYTIEGVYNDTQVQIDSIVIENLSRYSVTTINNLPTNVTDYVIKLNPVTSQLKYMNSSTGNEDFIISKNITGKSSFRYVGSEVLQAIIYVYNVSGQVVKLQSLNLSPHESVEVSIYNPGVYFINILTNKTQNVSYKALGGNEQGNIEISKAKFETNKIIKGDNSPYKIVQHSDGAIDVTLSYKSGDILQVAVYKNGYYTVPIEREVVGNEDFKFNFNKYTDTYFNPSIYVEMPNETSILESLNKYTIITADFSAPLNYLTSAEVKRKNINVNLQNKISSNNGIYYSNDILLPATGRSQLVILNNEFNMPVIYGEFDLINLEEMEQKVVDFVLSANSTALCALMTHPLLLTSSSDMKKIIRSNLLSLPSFLTYRSAVAEKMKQLIDNPTDNPEDYNFTKLPGYNYVLADYYGKYKRDNMDIPKSHVDPPTILERTPDNKIKYKITNYAHRTIGIYVNKVWIDEKAGIYKREPISTQLEDEEEPTYPFSFEIANAIFDTPMPILLDADNFKYKNIVLGTIEGWWHDDVPNYVFKSETKDIQVDLGLDGANGLEWEIVGFGTKREEGEKSISEYSKEEKAKFLIPVIYGIYNDYFDALLQSFKSVSEKTPEVSEGKIDLRYGKKKDIVRKLIGGLTKSFMKDENNWLGLVKHFDDKNYLDCVKNLAGFVIEEITSDLKLYSESGEDYQPKYANYIYKLYKEIFGFTKTSDDFRLFYKQGMHSLLHNIGVATKTIDIIEAGANLGSSLYYTFDTKPKETFWKRFDDNAVNTVTDIDGNVYHTVTIGTQTWMVENLKTTRYRNGDAIGTTTASIPNDATSKYQWAYNNDENNVAKYGRLYTWYAATDTRNIAPVGWHVPTDAEWTTLESYLIANGYNYDGTTTGDKTAKSLAATTDWNTYTTTGTIGNDLTKNNSSGFTALPGGYRYYTGTFYGIGYYGYWWSSTEYYTTGAWGRRLYYGDADLGRGSTSKHAGFSVRCIRD